MTATSSSGGPGMDPGMEPGMDSEPLRVILGNPPMASG
jgi:hypothetical protein